ncbi:phosphatidate cytidylyltransferase [Roseibium aggregatum]|uniref:phosphatidate cytidylyltransferase n=1 Tax=Roseibium aggregatum TaxID=187304 RepID=UPI002E29EFA0|nr:phosphatidate cytidylyltransferase [Roseibium aggregatum]
MASAAVLAPAVLGLTYLGGAAYSVLMFAAAALFLWEWFKITGIGVSSGAALTGFASLSALAVLVFFGFPLAGLAVLLAGVASAYALLRFQRSARWCLEGILYSGFALYSLLLVREGEHGLLFSFFLLIVVWATDIFAYFTGRALGGPKLWKRVSPKKTWSGAIGGLVIATLFGGGIAYFSGARNVAAWTALALALSVVSQGGDLLESAIKRRFDVKDSSQLIPGHGGIMDRIDGLVAAAIAAVVAGLAFGGTLDDPISGFGLS